MQGQFLGLDDLWSPRFDPVELLAQRGGDASTIVLCHNPDAADHAVWDRYQGWILAGHTHGGQCKPPFLPPAAARQEQALCGGRVWIVWEPPNVH